MPLVPCKCPECGAQIEVSPEKEAANCSFCGTPFIVEKAIKNYNTTQNATVINNYYVTNESQIKKTQGSNNNGRSPEYLLHLLDREDNTISNKRKILSIFNELFKENQYHLDGIKKYYEMGFKSEAISLMEKALSYYENDDSKDNEIVDVLVSFIDEAKTSQDLEEINHIIPSKFINHEMIVNAQLKFKTRIKTRNTTAIIVIVFVFIVFILMIMLVGQK